MSTIRSLSVVAGALACCLCLPGPGRLTAALAAAAEQPGEACRELAARDFSRVEDAPARLLSAEPEQQRSGPAFCHVLGYAAPNTGFDLLLPDAWNGKFLHLGSGGHGGSIAPAQCLPAVARGYACVTSDMGHRSTILDSVWARDNLQAQVDWGFRATHVVTLAAKAVVESHYGHAPAHSYFAGCSTGGRQALQAAQRFPFDYDGIIAGAPPIRLSDLYVTFAWGERTLRPQGAPLLSMADLKLLTEGALKSCDRDDGIADGIIGNPLRCSFRPSRLQCAAGQTNSCLDEHKVAAAARIYSGPLAPDGKPLFGRGAAPGSELGAPIDAPYGGNWGIYYQGTDRTPPAYASLTREGLRNLFFWPSAPSDWTLEQFDFARDPRRLDVMQFLYDSSNPDLGRFRDAGGKLILFHGYNDLSVLPHWVIDYYRKVEAVMGGPAVTARFARLYSLPGVEHCGGGVGADRVDWLGALERWVEQGAPPHRLTAYHLRGDHLPPESPITSSPSSGETIAFSRPVYPWPAEAHYRGGDPTRAESFGSVQPRR